LPRENRFDRGNPIVEQPMAIRAEKNYVRHLVPPAKVCHIKAGCAPSAHNTCRPINLLCRIADCRPARILKGRVNLMLSPLMAPHKSHVVLNASAGIILCLSFYLRSFVSAPATAKAEFVSSFYLIPSVLVVLCAAYFKFFFSWEPLEMSQSELPASGSRLAASTGAISFCFHNVIIADYKMRVKRFLPMHGLQIQLKGDL